MIEEKNVLQMNKNTQPNPVTNNPKNFKEDENSLSLNLIKRRPSNSNISTFSSFSLNKSKMEGDLKSEISDGKRIDLDSSDFFLKNYIHNSKGKHL
jgi:hypothetical protein